MKQPSTEAELLELIQSKRAQLDTLLCPLADAQLTQPGVVGDWSLRDVLAHVTYWEQDLLRRLQARTLDIGVEFRRPVSESDIDTINEEIVRRKRELPVKEVLEESRRSYALIVQAVTSLSHNDLFNPDRAQAVIGQAGAEVWRLVAAETCDHYEEHAEQIQTWLSSLGNTAGNTANG